ncbi:hypothetical protein HRM2_33180 [Desulforapulum autotrophicum HRM2]|uniref:Uncharacterized protein n=1 Tax=Desulforapulum autotrophicum (strain ATCC 43914 / DSM 3382 / VKM B-1955 / HRM2) TaxID=177437 RepID=C0QM76_DESAH|nr:hypothetical protein [Desulforapulum autotrophicum]ACN16393.1 hypothetical protein HRM2_33180 [Desulforapulum autotrophicum HRM2]
MKITNPETIKASEREFIDNINAELDWEAIEALLLEKHNFTLEEDVDYKKGDLVVFNDQIAYKFDFHIKVPLSVVFGRDGSCLDISTAGFTDKSPEPVAPVENAMLHNDSTGGNHASGMASTIADLISDINQEDK